VAYKSPMRASEGKWASGAFLNFLRRKSRDRGDRGKSFALLLLLRSEGGGRSREGMNQPCPSTIMSLAEL